MERRANKTRRSGYPGCPPAASARFHSRAKNREGGRASTGATGRRTPHGPSTPACGQAARISQAEAERQGGQPWPANRPEAWETTAVDLTRCNNRTKNRAWRRIKAESPDAAAAMQRDIPKLQAAFGRIGVVVARDYIEEDDEQPISTPKSRHAESAACIKRRANRSR